jgi:hypothetical protein
MNEHQEIMDYLISKGEDSWDVGFRATKILREIEKARYLSPKQNRSPVVSRENENLLPKPPVTNEETTHKD